MSPAGGGTGAPESLEYFLFNDGFLSEAQSRLQRDRRILLFWPKNAVCNEQNYKVIRLGESHFMLQYSRGITCP